MLVGSSSYPLSCAVLRVVCGLLAVQRMYAVRLSPYFASVCYASLSFVWRSFVSSTSVLSCLTFKCPVASTRFRCPPFQRTIPSIHRIEPFSHSAIQPLLQAAVRHYSAVQV